MTKLDKAAVGGEDGFQRNWIITRSIDDLQKSIRLPNQFASGIGVPVVRSLVLAVPSLKREWKQV